MSCYQLRGETKQRFLSFLEFPSLLFELAPLTKPTGCKQTLAYVVFDTALGPDVRDSYFPPAASQCLRIGHLGGRV